MPDQPQSFAYLCQKSSKLQLLYSRSRKIAQLDLIVQAFLPANFTNRCRLVNYQNKIVTLITDNAAIASILRFQSRQLSIQLTEHTELLVEQINIKVRPDFQILPRRESLRNNVSISAENGDLIGQTADTIDNRQLRDSLKRLAKHANKN